MKTTLIIPDLHLRWQHANKIIENNPTEEIIFLGDYFDNFGDDPNQVEEMCDWLEHSVNQPNRIHLFGNHDIQYAFDNKFFRCSGYEQWKEFIIKDRFNSFERFWSKFRYYHILDNIWFLLHGGLHPSFIPKSISKIENRDKFYSELSTYLDSEIIKGHRNQSWIFGIGKSRGGAQNHGGIVWCDFNREFEPILGLNQIVGHTSLRTGKAEWLIESHDKISFDNFEPSLADLKNINKSSNICLDVYMNTHYAIWNGEILIIKDYNSLL